MSVVKVDNLTKKYGDFTAVSQINFTIESGEVFGFIGPNGAGKTTAIRVMLGILKANGGSVQLFGKDAWKDAVEIHKRIAYVPGDVSLWQNLTGGEVIDLFMRLRGGNDQAKKAQLIERFCLDPTKKCRNYSKGNRQKVALISAFSTDADLYIFDEPTSGLDPLMGNVFAECVLEVKKQGKAVLLSSHILQEVEKLCDRIGIIRNGEIIETGTMEELRHLTRTHILVMTKKRVENLDRLEGVNILKDSNDGLSLSVDSNNINQVIKHLSAFDIVKLECAPPSLEELFMSHYKSARG